MSRRRSGGSTTRCSGRRSVTPFIVSPLKAGLMLACAAPERTDLYVLGLLPECLGAECRAAHRSSARQSIIGRPAGCRRGRSRRSRLGESQRSCADMGRTRRSGQDRETPTTLKRIAACFNEPARPQDCRPAAVAATRLRAESDRANRASRKMAGISGWHEGRAADTGGAGRHQENRGETDGRLITDDRSTGSHIQQRLSDRILANTPVFPVPIA